MANLDGTLPALQTAFDGLTSYLSTLGIRVAVADYGGFRTQADTAQILQYRQDDYDAAVKAGQVSPATTLDEFRPIAAYGSSFHDYGAAFDLAVEGEPSGVTAEQALAMAGGVAPQYGLRWGGNFSNPDYDHFELNESLAQAADDYSAYVASGGGSSNLPGFASVLVVAAIAAVGALVYAGHRLLSQRGG